MKKKFKWRKLNNIIHRDFGYFFAGLTIIYAVSGIAVNHMSDWNPSYIIKRKTINLEYDSINDKNIRKILKKLNIEDKKYKKVQTDVNLTQIFLKDKTISINTKSKKINFESVQKRTVFYSFNKLHLNHLKGFWTYFADFYAFVLILLSITGFFVLKGKNGLKWRGAILGALGLVIPLIFIFIF